MFNRAKAILERELFGGGKVASLWGVFSLVFIPVFLLAVFSYSSLRATATGNIYAQKRALAYLYASLIRERLNKLELIGESLAARPRVIEGVAQGNWQAAINALQNVPDSFPAISRIDLTDDRGVIRANFPSQFSLIGSSQRDQEWFKMVSGNRKSYVSGVYQISATPYHNSVAVAVPVKGYSAKNILGLLVMKIRIDYFGEGMKEFAYGQGQSVNILDDQGRMVFRPDLTPQGKIVDLSKTGIAKQIRSRGAGIKIIPADHGRGKLLCAFESIPGYNWAVVVFQPVSKAFYQRDRNLRLILIVYLLILVLSLSIVYLLLRIFTERRAVEEALLRSEERYRGLYDSIRDGLVLTGLDGRIIECNRSFSEMLGYTQEEIKKFSYQQLTPQKWLRQELETAMRQVVERGYSEEYEKEYIKKNGQIVPVLIRVWLIKDEYNESKGMWKIVRDISERKNSEEKIKKLTRDLQIRAEQLEFTNKELQAFSYSVAHDLRAPLRSMDGFSRALLEDYGEKLDSRAKGYIARICNADRSMAELIDDLLDLSNVAHAKFTWQLFDLSEAAAEVCAELQAQAPGRKVECIIQGGVTVKGDKQLMKIALQNLLGNAWKFTGKNEKAKLEFGAQENPDGRIYFVRDNGAGFDMTYADKLFVPFQRLHSSAEYPGTGIGLATVMRIINRHGGKVWGEGAPGKGAVFYFTIRG